MKTYTLQHRINSDGRGTTAECVVHTTDWGTEVLSPDLSQQLYNHSPDGFEFGFGGSGPAQLALAILQDHCRTHRDAYPNPDQTALELHQDFKWHFIARADDAALLWVYRERSPAGAWYLHGIFS